MIESGSCGSGLILTTSECEAAAAATALGLPDKTADDLTSSNYWSYPPGCSFCWQSTVALAVYGGGSTGSCSSVYKCICKSTSP